MLKHPRRILTCPYCKKNVGLNYEAWKTTINGLITGKVPFIKFMCNCGKIVTVTDDMLRSYYYYPQRFKTQW